MQRYLSESERASTGVMDGFLDWNNVFNGESDPSGYLDSVGRIFLEMAKLAFRQGSLFGSSDGNQNFWLIYNWSCSRIFRI